MGTMIFAAVALALLGFAAAQPRGMFVLAFLLGGVPLTLIAGTGAFYAALGNMNAQAAYVLLLLLGSAIVLIRGLGAALQTMFRYWGMTLFLVYAACSLVWTADLLTGLRMLGKLATPLLFFWAISTLKTSDRQALVLERCLYITCVISIALAVVNLVTHGALAPGEKAGGLFGLPALAAPYTSAANFSFLIMTGAICAYCRLLQRPGALQAALVALFFGAILFAFVRITLVATLVGLVIVHSLAARKSTVLMFLAVLLVAIPLGVTSEAFSKRMFFNPERVHWVELLSAPATFMENVNTSGRSGLWTAATQHFQESDKTLGAGVGAVDSWIALQGRGGSQLHSEFLRVFLELGWLGLGALLLGIVQFWLRLKFEANAVLRRTGRVPVLLRAALGTFSAYVITLATDNSLNYVSEFSIYVFGTAIVGVGLAKSIAQRSRAASPTSTAATPLPAANA